MILKETIRSAVRSQAGEARNFDYGIERERLAGTKPVPSFALVITGIRRCGKSTFLRQMMRKLGKTGNANYFSFDDPRAMNFEAGDFQKLDEVLLEEYGESGLYFFDEIQNVDRWELFARPLLERKKSLVITGSNASLLSRELGTRLTGRHLDIEMFPFSYGEFLMMKGRKAGLESFRDYLEKGGFPEYLKSGNRDILRHLLEDILNRDIAVRHGIRSLKPLREMALYLLTNAGKEFTYNSLAKAFGLAPNSAISFVSHFEDSYLLFTVPKFDYSPKKQLVGPKKSYSIDNGLSNANSLSFSEDRGRMLENMVFLGLRRKHREIYYFRENNECDFVVKEGAKITSAIQVCAELDEDNKKRETSGLLEALARFRLGEGLILTMNQEDELHLEGKRILVKPAWKWLLGNG